MTKYQEITPFEAIHLSHRAQNAKDANAFWAASWRVRKSKLVGAHEYVSTKASDGSEIRYRVGKS